MPLLDHFRPPLTPRHAWESFHANWAGSIMAAIIAMLPRDRYFAESVVSVGRSFEIDVATWESDAPSADRNGSTPGGGGVVTAVAWAPPAPALTMPATFPDEFGVRVFDTNRGGAVLVGAIELVSPGNKDRPEKRHAFAAKCGAFLQRGVGLLVVDVVTEYRANLHNDLVERLDYPPECRFPHDADLYAMSYRPVRRGGVEQTDLWPAALAVGGPLPVMPLALLEGPVIPIDLNGTYDETRQRCGL